MTILHSGILLALFSLAASATLAAQADSTRATRPDSQPLPSQAGAPSHGLDTVKVTGRADDLAGVATTASEGHIGAADLRLRPITREGELLESVPGMIVTQHSGEGKANQYFVRGFNLDHGTDFQTRVEGMPINMPTHAHGQGYTDLNFLIPELVDYLDYKLGVYHSEVGDFGSAGAAEFHLFHRLDHPFATVAAGENRQARIAAGGSTRIGAGDLLVGGEARTYNGPWAVAEKIRKFSGLARYSWDRGGSSFSLLGMAYHNRWNSNDQIPLRAVTSGLISRFGQIDSTDGGNTERYSLSGSWRHVGGSAVEDVQLFGIYSDLSLVSDFTYFLDNPNTGDQFNQREHRRIVGGNAQRSQQLRALGVDHVLTIGLQTRADFLGPVGLYHTEKQQRISTVRQDDVREWGSGIYLDAESHWTSRFRSTLGVRGDEYIFHVVSSLPENSGDRTAGIVSPKASFAYALSEETELYLSGGLGFHSNDARGTTITVDPASGAPVQRVDPLVRSHGAELGLRATPVRNLRTTISLWALDLDSELLFTGDGGTTEPSAASRRRGITCASFYRPIPHLSIDADVSLARARFTGVAPRQDHIPGALENVVAAGVAWNPDTRGAYGSLRLRHFGSYPLTEDNSVRASSTSLLSAEAGYRYAGIRLQASMLNILDARADDIQYYYASRLPGEPADGVNDVHFHPIEPRQVRASLGWDF